MIKIICVNCHIDLRPETNGTCVIEMAGKDPYKVWDADTWKCPKCGVEVVTGFGNEPVRADNYAADFPEWLERYKTTVKRVEYDYEFRGE